MKKQSLKKIKIKPDLPLDFLVPWVTDSVEPMRSHLFRILRILSLWLLLWFLAYELWSYKHCFKCSSSLFFPENTWEPILLLFVHSVSCFSCATKTKPRLGEDCLEGLCPNLGVSRVILVTVVIPWWSAWVAMMKEEYESSSQKTKPWLRAGCWLFSEWK